MRPTADQTEDAHALSEIVSSFSKQDALLKNWISSLPDDEWAAMLANLADRWFKASPTRNWFKDVWPHLDGPPSPDEKEAGAILLVHELRQYGGHTWNVFGEKPHYEEILRRTHKRFAKRYKRQVSRSRLG